MRDLGPRRLALAAALGLVMLVPAGCSRAGSASTVNDAPTMRVQPTYVGLGSTTGPPAPTSSVTAPSATASSLLPTQGSTATGSATSRPASGETPTGSASATPAGRPSLPAEAATQTQRGAEAFVTYYFETVDYGFQTGDTQLLLAASTSTCTTTADFARSIRELAQDTARPVGPTQDVVITGGSLPQPGTALVSVRYATRGVELVRPDRSRATVAPTQPRALTAHLLWSGTGWRMASLTS